MAILLFVPFQADDVELNTVETRLLLFVPVEAVAAEDRAFHGLPNEWNGCVCVEEDRHALKSMRLRHPDCARDKNLDVFPDVVRRGERGGINNEISDRSTCIERSKVIGFEPLLLNVLRDLAYEFLDG